MGSLLTPLLAWAFFGLGFGSTAAAPLADGATFSQHFFPGAALLSSMFVAIFASSSLIEDRHAGFLQGVLVAPSSRSALVLGKVLGGTAIALFHGTLFLLLAPCAGISPTFDSFFLALVAMTAGSFCLSAVGFFAAWHLDSSQGFHSFMNTAFFPAWLLSGAFFPESAMPTWARYALAANPLSHAYNALRAALLEPHRVGFVLAESAIVAGFAAICFGIATAAARRPLAA